MDEGISTWGCQQHDQSKMCFDSKLKLKNKRKKKQKFTIIFIFDSVKFDDRIADEKIVCYI